MVQQNFQSHQIPYSMPPPMQQPMIPAFPGAKRRRVSKGDETDAPSCMLLVPSTSVGQLIGKAGSGLKQLSAQTGAKMAVERDEIFGDRLVTVIGSEDAQKDCVHSICSVLQPNPGEELTMKFLIPDNITGAIVGKKGAGLAAFKTDYGVGVELPREDFQGQRVLSVIGAVEGLQAASAHIVRVLSAPPHPR